MKNNLKILTACTIVLVLVISVISTKKINSQTVQNFSSTVVIADSTVAIPDSINLVLTRSCTPCHAGGNANATSKLDLANWTDYTLQQSRRISAEICETMSTGDMPPRMARQSKPELIPTAEQTADVCKWVSSLAVKE